VFSSKRIDDLETPAKIRALKFLTEARGELAPLGVDVIVTCTVRDGEAQNDLYAHGRTRAQLDAAGLHHVEPKPGRILTNATAGDSFHQWKVALDVMLVRHGKLIDDDTPEGKALWQRLGEIGERCGLVWAGRWLGRLKEECHFQYTGALKLADFKAGMTLTEATA